MNYKETIAVLKACKNLNLKSLKLGKLELEFQCSTSNPNTTDSRIIALPEHSDITPEPLTDIDMGPEVTSEDFVKEYNQECLAYEDPLQYEMNLRSIGNN